MGLTVIEFRPAALFAFGLRSLAKLPIKFRFFLGEGLAAKISQT